MRLTKPVILGVLAAGTLGAVTQAAAAPAPLTPGGSVNPIPTYSGTGMPTVDVLHDTGLQTMSANGMTVDFEEWAVHTNLNPSGVVFAFAISTVVARRDAPGLFRLHDGGRVVRPVQLGQYLRDGDRDGGAQRREGRYADLQLPRYDTTDATHRKPDLRKQPVRHSHQRIRLDRPERDGDGGRLQLHLRGHRAQDELERA